ncbi:MAG: hypothetical protein CM15mL6_060 [uncultured marine virus]|nr:MAG: hypothetical protein CM15mL6_060 [uncultured marine virus]
MQPSSYTIAENWGFQFKFFMVPLDKSKTMKKRGRQDMKKNKKLEYEITRAHKFGFLIKKRFYVQT